MPTLKEILHFHVVAPALRIWYHPKATGEWLELGWDHGTWWVPAFILRPNAVAYLGGVGGDITFDKDLLDRGLIVRSFDPTPNSRLYMESHAPQSERFTFVPLGWWSNKDTLKMYRPRNPADFSHSATNLWDTAEYDELPVESVAGCMRALGDEHVDLVKIDVEGAEREVLAGMLRDGLSPEVICVEFDPPVREAIKAIAQLRARGYKLGKIDGWNYTFVRKRA